MNEEKYVYDQPALSRAEADLGAAIEDSEPQYDQPPLSRIEYLLQQISGGVSSGIHLKGVVASTSSLPVTAENGDMYFVGPDANDAYREVVWLDLDSKGESGDWEELGYNAIDVDAFVKKSGDTMTGTLKNQARLGFQYGYKASSGMYAVEMDTIENGVGQHIKLRNLPNVDRQEIYNVADALAILLRENSTAAGTYNFPEVVLCGGMHKNPSTNAIVTKQYVDNSFEPALLSYIDGHIKTQAEYDALQDKTGFWFIKEATT